MPQTYARRVALRPHYQRYKDVKRQLRKAVQSGRITQAERDRHQAQAYELYKAGIPPPTPDLPTKPGLCSPSCQQAKGRVCKCRCGGIGHPRPVKPRGQWLCGALDCDQPGGGLGWCSQHAHLAGTPPQQARWKPNPKKRREGCKVVGCDRKHHARGWCQRHYQTLYYRQQPKRRNHN